MNDGDFLHNLLLTERNGISGQYSILKKKQILSDIVYSCNTFAFNLELKLTIDSLKPFSSIRLFFFLFDVFNDIVKLTL